MPIISQVVRPIPIALSLKTSSFLLFLPHAFYTELYVAISSGSLHIYARESTICDSLFAKGSFRFGKSALLLSRAFLTRLGEELNVSLMMIIHIPLLNIIKKKINSIFPIIIFLRVLLYKQFHSNQQNTTIELHVENAWTSTCPQLPLRRSSQISTNICSIA